MAGGTVARQRLTELEPRGDARRGAQWRTAIVLGWSACYFGERKRSQFAANLLNTHAQPVSTRIIIDDRIVKAVPTDSSREDSADSKTNKRR